MDDSTLDGQRPDGDDTPPAAAARPAPAPVVDDELVAFAADPELAGMFISDALDHLGTIEATILKLEASPADLNLINDVFRPFHTVKGNAGVIGLTSIQEFAHTVETLLDLARAGKRPLGPSEIDLVLQTVDVLTLMVNALPARAAGQPATDLSARRRELMARVELMIADGPAESPGPAAVETSASDDDAATALGAIRPASAWDDGQSTVKVGTRKLDDLVEMVGELVIAQTILAEDPALLRSADERLTRRLAHVRRITSTLQRDTMAMRMVPIRPTFQKMGRLLRDLSKKFNKPTSLTVSGEETELDRKVVEHLTDLVDAHGAQRHRSRRGAGRPARPPASRPPRNCGSARFTAPTASSSKSPMTARAWTAAAFWRGRLRRGWCRRTRS